MGKKVIEVRDYTFAVEAKSGSQLAFIITQMEKLTDEQLAMHMADYVFFDLKEKIQCPIKHN